MNELPELQSSEIQTKNEPIISLILVNGTVSSVQAPRAQALFNSKPIIHFKSHGRLKSIFPAIKAINPVRKGIVYCIDLGFPQAAIAALSRRLKGKFHLIYEIGDPMRPLLSGQGKKGIELAMASWFDKYLPHQADALVFRGSYLYQYFQTLRPQHSLPPSLWLPDGVDIKRFHPQKDSHEVKCLRSKYNLNSKFIVGLVGNIHYSPVHHLFYGWELVEAIARLPENSNIIGVIVGDGPGRPILEQTITKYGLENRIKLIGRVPHNEVPLWMNVFDVALSTQTDDPVGWGRTTAKLPEYLACGTPAICSDIGEAHRLLKNSGQTLPYKGMRDESYPEKLATKLLELSPKFLNECQLSNRATAEKQFAYPLLNAKLQSFLNQLEAGDLKSGDWIV